MAQHSFIRVSGGSPVTCDTDTQRWLTNDQPNRVLLCGADFKNRRVIPFHRKFFYQPSGFDYWHPEGYFVSCGERELVHGYVGLLAYYGGHGDSAAELADRIFPR